VDNIVDVTPGDPATSSSTATGLRVRGGNTFTSTTFFVPLGQDRAVRIRSRNSNAFVVVEFLGYFSPSQSTDTYFAKPLPQRVLDTRGFSGSPRTSPLGGNQVQDVPIRGVAGVPANATSVLVNLTGFEATTGSTLLAYGANNHGTTTVVGLPSGPAVEHLDRAHRRLRQDPCGQQQRQPGRGGARHPRLVRPRQRRPYVTLPEAARIADTATGTGPPKALVGQGQSVQVQVGGIAGVSTAATTAALVVTGTDNLVGTDLSVRAAEAAWSPVTDISTKKLEPRQVSCSHRLATAAKSTCATTVAKRACRLMWPATSSAARKASPASVGNCVVPADDAGYVSAYDARSEADLEGWRTAGAKRIKTDGCDLVTDSGADVNWYMTHTYNNDYTVKLDFQSTTANSDSGCTC